MCPRLENGRRLRAMLVAVGVFTLASSLPGQSPSTPVERPRPNPPRSTTGPTDSTRVMFSTRGSPPIFTSAAQGDVEGLQRMIAEGADVNARGTNGLTPLMVAAFSGREPIVRALLEAKADPNLKDNLGRTALYFSIWYNRLVVTRLLLENGADVQRIYDDGQSALVYAMSLWRREHIDLLLQRGVDLSGEGPAGSLMHYAAMRQERGLLESLLARGESIDRPTAREEITPLMRAAAAGTPNAVRVVLELGANVNLQDRQGWSALMHAAHRDQLANVDLLLHAKPDLDLVATTGETAYILARRRGHEALAEKLVRAGAKPLPVTFPRRSASWNALSSDQRFGLAMAALELHLHHGDLEAVPGVARSTNEAQLHLRERQKLSDADKLRETLDSLLAVPVETTAADDIAALSETEFQARLEAVLDDPVKVIALKTARLQPAGSAIKTDAAWRLCHHNYLVATGATAGWLAPEEAWRRMGLAANQLRGEFESWAQVAPALTAGLRRTSPEIAEPRAAALTALLLNPEDPESPWNRVPFRRDVE